MTNADIRALAHQIKGYMTLAKAGNGIVSMHSGTLETWYGQILNAAGIDYCDECGSEHPFADLNYPYPGADSATCKLCAADAEEVLIQ